MTERKVYLGSEGPFLYDDTELLLDPDSDWAGEAVRAFLTDGDTQVDGTHTIGILGLLDTDDSHSLAISWTENDSANRTLGLSVSGGNRTIAIQGNSVIDQDYSIDADVTFNSATLYGRDAFRYAFMMGGC